MGIGFTITKWVIDPSPKVWVYILGLVFYPIFVWITVADKLHN